MVLRTYLSQLLEISASIYIILLCVYKGWLDFKDQIPEVVGMFQKEVAERIAAGPGSKTYGITSVLLQALERMIPYHQVSFFVLHIYHFDQFLQVHP